MDVGVVMMMMCLLWAVVADSVIDRVAILFAREKATPVLPCTAAKLALSLLTVRIFTF